MILTCRLRQKFPCYGGEMESVNKKNEDQLNEIRKILHKWVDEMYPMEIGTYISELEKRVAMGDGYLDRKQVKHVIEQRKEEGKTIEELKFLFDEVVRTMGRYDFETPNTNPRYPGSVMRIALLGEYGDGTVVVMDEKRGNVRKIITAFRRDAPGIKALKKKLQKSTPGETPLS